MIRVASHVALAFVITAGIPVFLLLYVVTLANEGTVYSNNLYDGTALSQTGFRSSALASLLKIAEEQNIALRQQLSSLSKKCSDSSNRVVDVQSRRTDCPHCEEFQLPLAKCQVIHVAIVCAGFNASRDVVTLLKSILIYRRNLLHFHFLSDSSARLILGELMSTWRLNGVEHTFYSIEDIKDRVAWVPNRHYAGVYGLLKLLLPDVLSSLDHVIVLDTDITLASDISELWSLFLLLNSTQAIGAVENLSNWYLGTIWKDHRPWPARGRGFNTGVMLMNLTMLREMKWSVLWRDVTRRQLIHYTATQLADQDIINAVSAEHDDLMGTVPCEWNIQLSENARLDALCPVGKSNVKAIHLNAPQKQRAHSTLARHFKNLYSMFVEYDGKLLRQAPATYGCSGMPNDSINVESDFQLARTAGASDDDAASEVCDDFNGERMVSYRTHLYYVDHEYSPPIVMGADGQQRMATNDVTLVAQLSVDRLQTLESLCTHWPGPMSLAIYLSDSDTQHFLQYVQDSEVVGARRNIGFHVVFRDGKYYPVNRLRNIALRQVKTPYAFLSDIDFLPIHGLYEYLKDAVQVHNLSSQRKVLVVPAFETQRYHFTFPATKDELITQLDTNVVTPFRVHIWPKGHSPTNFTLWREATQPYQVRWQQDFEPYVVVNRKLVAMYDERFVGFGWNKVSHIMELDAQGFAFLVLPNAFIIHMPHAPSFDIAKYRTSATYRRCLRQLKMDFQKDLSRRYGVRALKYLSTD